MFRLDLSIYQSYWNSITVADVAYVVFIILF